MELKSKQIPTEPSSHWYVHGGQINLQKGHTSAAAFQAHLTPNLRTGVTGSFPGKNINSAFLFGLQDLPVFKGKIVGFGTSLKLIYSNKNGDPRAAINPTQSLHIWSMMEFCDRDTATGLWKTGNNNINENIVVSVYMDILLSRVCPVAFEQLLGFCEKKKKEVLICGKTNAWSTLWGTKRDEQKR